MWILTSGSHSGMSSGYGVGESVSLMKMCKGRGIPLAVPDEQGAVGRAVNDWTYRGLTK